MKSVVFLGGKEIGEFCLANLLEFQASYGIKLIGVIPNGLNKLSNSEKIIEIAETNQVPVFSDISQISDEVDYIVSVQYNKILTPSQISKAKKLALNLHMAPLPEYRGCNQFSFALIDGVAEFGTTLHIIEAGIDSGPILFERRFQIPNNTFVEELYYITLEESKRLIEASFPDLFMDNYSLNEQSDFKERSSGFHQRNEIESLKKIQKSWTNEKKKRFFRATYFPPYDPPSLYDQDRFIKSLTIDWYKSLDS